jgi:hypothetical protein
VRIASVHGHVDVGSSPPRGKDEPGVYVDPRYRYDSRTCQIDPVAKAAGISDCKNTFGTLPCKFDIKTDPSFPDSGRAVTMLEQASSGRLDAALMQQAQAPINQGKSHYSTYRRTGSQAEYYAALDAFRQAADVLRVKFAPVGPEGSRTREDDLVALGIAKAVLSHPEAGHLLPGNRLDQKTLPPRVHYPESAGHPLGFSLGDWGPVDTQDDGRTIRKGAPVITMEVFGDDDSGAFYQGLQLVDDTSRNLDPVSDLSEENKKRARKRNAKRCRELLAYASGLINEFLMIEKAVGPAPVMADPVKKKRRCL